MPRRGEFFTGRERRRSLRRRPLSSSIVGMAPKAEAAMNARDLLAVLLMIVPSFLLIALIAITLVPVGQIAPEPPSAVEGAETPAQ